MNSDWKDALAALRADVPDIPDAEQPVTDITDKKKQTLTIAYERKGRGGHPATIIVCDPDGDADDIAGLATTLRQRLGTGGSVRDNEILLQGDRRTAVRTILANLGYTVKG